MSIIIDSLNNIIPSIRGITKNSVFQTLGELFNINEPYNRHVLWGGKAKGQGSVPNIQGQSNDRPTIRGLNKN